jgi:signal transduction histidine kinase
LAEGVRSLIKVPLLVRGALIGTLNLGRLTPGPFAPEQRDIAREVADSLAVAIQQVRLREALRAYASTMEQLVDERTAELETFAYPVAHDLRAPLRAIQGFSDALLEEYGDRLDSVGQEYARRIIDSAQRLDNLIQALLAYARLSRVEIQLQPVDLAMAVAEAVAVVDTERLEREAQVTIEQPLPEVMAHRTILVQVITNLLTNAIKFVPPGVQPNVRLWAEPRDKYIRLWVEDNGIGIAPEHQDRIFQIFDRLHGNETYPGTGIGLAIVHKGVRRMGGRIGVESAPGQGSRFWVELVRP